MKGLILLCLLAVPVSAAEMYRWVDKDGRVHFSDKPPPDAVNSNKVTVKEAPRLSGNDEGEDSAERVQRAVTAMQGDRQAREAGRAEQQKQKAERQAACDKAQKEWNDYNRANIRVTRDENNEVRGLSEQEMRDIEQQMQQQIRRYCS